MKKLFLLSTLALTTGAFAQIQTPQLSPLSKLEQTVGLTDIQVEYSRPSKRDRAVFTDVVAYGEIWRTGANKNTIITTSDVLIFDKDTLQAGAYAIFTKPEKGQWTIYFYKSTDNWGNPKTWDDKEVAVSTTASVKATSSPVETFTISIDNVDIDGAALTFAWDNVVVSKSFKVATDSRVEGSISKVLSGPTANDYYRAADYYFNAGKDLKKALEWVDKALTMQTDSPFWMYRRKSQIQAGLGDYKGAVATAQKSLELAKKAGNNDYVRMNEASIKEWSAKK